MYYTYHDSPVGRLLLAGDDTGLHLISFPSGRKTRSPERDWVEDARPVHDAIAQLDAYFAGTLQEFSLTLAPVGTPFQLQVWQALREIPYGETWSYGRVAQHIGRPTASRAVGAANGCNPLPIVIPCHRVIGSTGHLTGFGGGLGAKATLLALEQQYAPRAGCQAVLPLAGVS